MKSSENPILEARGLRRFLGESDARLEVLRGIDLRLHSGQVTAVVGPSGCGKSTLLYLLGLLDHPDGGEILIRNHRVDTAGDAERTRIRGKSIGFVFQFHFLLSEFSSAENLMLPMLKMGKWSREEARHRAEQLLESVGLREKADRRGNQLSGGERQRVAVARALVNDPDIVLADEPTGNLDSRNSEHLFGNLRDLARSGDRSVLVVTHNRELAGACDHCLEMQDGLFV